MSGMQRGRVDGERTDASSVSTKHVVFYLPDDPNVSCIGNPRPMLWIEMKPMVLAMLLFPPLAFLGWRQQFPRFRNWLSAKPQKASYVAMRRGSGPDGGTSAR